MEIGKNVRKIRELKNFTQEYMAAQLGISQPAYSKLESNGGEIHINRLIQVAKLLNVAIDDIIHFEDHFANRSLEKSPTNGHDKSIDAAYQILSERERALYEKQISLLIEEKNRLIDLYEKKINILMEHIDLLKVSVK